MESLLHFTEHWWCHFALLFSLSSSHLHRLCAYCAVLCVYNSSREQTYTCIDFTIFLMLHMIFTINILFLILACSLQSSIAYSMFSYTFAVFVVIFRPRRISLSRYCETFIAFIIKIYMAFCILHVISISSIQIGDYYVRLCRRPFIVFGTRYIWQFPLTIPSWSLNFSHLLSTSLIASGFYHLPCIFVNLHLDSFRCTRRQLREKNIEDYCYAIRQFHLRV